MKKRIFTTAFVLLSLCLFAQVSVNTDGTAPAVSAMLDVKSTGKGMLIPRMTQTQMEGIENITTGLSVYNTDVGAVCYFNGTDWDCMDAQSLFNKTFFCGDNLRDFRNNKSYTTVQIGSQCWMAENLAYLPEVSPHSQGDTTEPYYYVYRYDGTNVTEAKATNSYQIYGVLYNWPAAMAGEASSDSVPSGVRGICPPEWHIPADKEWKILEGEVDRTYNSNNPNHGWDRTGYRGTDAGKKLKSTSGWFENGHGTDLYGFGALPGGGRRTYGSWLWPHRICYWWSSREYSGAIAWDRYLLYDESGSGRGYESKARGASVRCLKDN